MISINVIETSRGPDDEEEDEEFETMRAPAVPSAERTCRKCGKVGRIPEEFPPTRRTVTTCRECRKRMDSQSQLRYKLRHPERKKLACHCKPGKASTCTRCGHVGFSPEDFYSFNRFVCKKCNRTEARTRAARPARRDANKNNALRRKYGITLGQFHAMCEAQSFACGICGRDPRVDLEAPKSHQVLRVDHCHKSGKVRGLLCNHCNHALGMLQDSPVLLRKAADYLEAHS